MEKLNSAGRRLADKQSDVEVALLTKINDVGRSLRSSETPIDQAVPRAEVSRFTIRPSRARMRTPCRYRDWPAFRPPKTAASEGVLLADMWSALGW